MTRIHILGGTGYAGSHIAAEAARRRHQVDSFSRHRPAEPAEGVTYQLGDLREDAALVAAFDGADVVVSALSRRGDLEGIGVLRALLRRAADLAVKHDVRFGVIGSSGSLRTEPGGLRVLDSPELPVAVRPEAEELVDVYEDLAATDGPHPDWFVVCPAYVFGAFAPGEATGRYRTGVDVVLRDADGVSAISGADLALALAVVDEIDNPTYHRQSFTVAY